MIVENNLLEFSTSVQYITVQNSTVKVRHKILSKKARTFKCNDLIT